MSLNRSVLEISGTPPADFSPSQMLIGVKAPWRHGIPVSNPKITIGATTAEASVANAQHNIQPPQQRIIPLTLEISNKGIAGTSLENIPFEVVMTGPGDAILSSEHQPTPWRFLVKVNAYSKQMSLSFTLNYSGLSVVEALKGLAFYKALAGGGEFRIVGRHPLTGGVLPIARGAIAEGSYQVPDSRFAETLDHLAFIEGKTGASFTIPEHDISFEDANTIAATAGILKTGHGQFTAKPWVIVSSIEQARSALESFAGKQPKPTAVHFEGQEVIIFGTHLMLGPVTFFCDRTYIKDEDLGDLRRQLESASEKSNINIRFTPFEGCLIEARYINWLPASEAAAMRELPMYKESEPLISEDNWTLPQINVADAVALLNSWYDENAEEQREMWESIKIALDYDRLSDRKLFR